MRDPAHPATAARRARPGPARAVDALLEAVARQLDVIDAAVAALDGRVGASDARNLEALDTTWGVLEQRATDDPEGVAGVIDILERRAAALLEGVERHLSLRVALDDHLRPRLRDASARLAMLQAREAAPRGVDELARDLARAERWLEEARRDGEWSGYELRRTVQLFGRIDRADEDERLAAELDRALAEVASARAQAVDRARLGPTLGPRDEEAEGAARAPYAAAYAHIEADLDQPTRSVPAPIREALAEARARLVARDYEAAVALSRAAAAAAQVVTDARHARRAGELADHAEFARVEAEVRSEVVRRIAACSRRAKG